MRLPSYLADAFGEVYGEDGLVCIGKGMGWLGLLGALVRYYSAVFDEEGGHCSYATDEMIDEYRAERRNPPDRSFLLQLNRPKLIFILGLRDSERRTLSDLLQSCWGMPSNMLPINITNESGDSSDRAVIYQKLLLQRHNGSNDTVIGSNVICITSRILIVDLLSSVIQSSDIDGIFVAHGENVNEQSTEAFIIRIYQSQRQQQLEKFPHHPSVRGGGFVKAFSDAPDQLMAGFGQVTKVLKSLHVRKLYLYPRFHDVVRNELEAPDRQPIVVEYHQPLSPLQKEIQNSIAATVVKCLRHLRTSTEHLIGGGGSTSSWDRDGDISIENCCSTYFDRAIQRQLEPYWHRLQPSTKQLVTDLRTLRTLLTTLLTYDCVSYWNLLRSIQSMNASSKHRAMWLLDPSADVIYNKAKQRVYTIVHPHVAPSAAATSTNSGPILNAVLEENPKWKLLRQVLTEIKQSLYRAESKSLTPQKDSIDSRRNKARNTNNKAKDTSTSDHATTGLDRTFGPINILVMVQDEKSLESVKSYLIGGKNQTILPKWLRYLELNNDRSRTISDSIGSTDTLSQESRLLLEEEGRVRRILFGSTNVSATRKRKYGKKSKSTTCQPSSNGSVPQYIRKHRKVATERARGKSASEKDDLDRRAVLEEAIQITEHEFSEHQLNTNLRPQEMESDDPKASGPQSLKHHDCSAHCTVQEQQTQIKDAFTSVPSSSSVTNIANTTTPNNQKDQYAIETPSFYQVHNPENEVRVVIKSYSSLEGEQEVLFLHDLQPKYIVMYDSDVAFVRAIEIYSASVAHTNPPGSRIRVYFLTFEASAEEKNFKKAMEREQNSFERLIHYKQTMAPPVLYCSSMTQEMNHALESGSGGIGGTYMGGTLPLAFDSTSTRHGKGKFNVSKVRRDIVVDVREFRSALPSILHLNGMRLAPVTLTIGDYVLTSVHCVERKSISDLFGSFASGRLYTQAESMSKYYKCPCLLIEFDPNKSFCLQNQRELGFDIKIDSICTKMALLTMHFPKLRIVWSRSPHETFKIFRELKVNHDEPDVERAMEYGRNDSDDDLLVLQDLSKTDTPSGSNNNSNKEEDNNVDEVNDVAKDMLMRLPGMTVAAARRIVQHVDTLAELCSLPRDELRNIAGPLVGQRLFSFFRQTLSNTATPQNSDCP